MDNFLLDVERLYLSTASFTVAIVGDVCYAIAERCYKAEQFLLREMGEL